MGERPELTTQLDSGTFRSFYYLKEELMQFCRENRLPASGGKLELTERIAYFLDTGECRVPMRQKKCSAVVSSITPEQLIEENFVCSEIHRAFFKEHIGESFSFCVAFQKWLKSNSGRTYQDAIAAYGEILKEKKNGKTEIERQFEYNTYIRDFFADNKGKSLEQAIACWKYKRAKQGHNKYERSDLKALSGIGK